MLVIRIELHPYGDADRVRELGRMTIVNVGGTERLANYDVKARAGRRIGHPAAIASGGGIWAEASTLDVLEAPDHSGQVLDHARLEEPVWSLLAKALASIGFRVEGPVTGWLP